MGAKILKLFFRTKFGLRTGEERSRSGAQAEASLGKGEFVNIYSQRKNGNFGSKNYEYTPKMPFVK